MTQGCEKTDDQTLATVRQAVGGTTVVDPRRQAGII